MATFDYEAVKDAAPFLRMTREKLLENQTKKPDGEYSESSPSVAFLHNSSPNFSGRCQV